MDPNIKQSIVDRLKQTNNVLVTVKSNPTVDQLAACIGLTLFLNKLGKHATAVFSGAVPSTIEFLKPESTLEKDTNSLRDFIISLDKSKADKLRYKVEDKVVKIFITPYRTSLNEEDFEFSQGDFNVDVVLALGVHVREELDQAIMAHGRILHDATVVSINNTKAADLGALNWNDPKASSLSEMVASLVDALQPNSLDAQMATAFLTGIVAETDRFSNPKTTSITMNLSAKLMAAGANQQLVATKLQEPVQMASPAAQPAGGNGELEIDHPDNKKDVELPPPAAPDGTETDNIHIDEHGNLSPGLQDQTPKDDKKPIEPAKPSRLALEPPTMGGALTANTIANQLDPSIDPLSGKSPNNAILSRNKQDADKPSVPEPKKADDYDMNRSLSELEEVVDSPHAQGSKPPELGPITMQPDEPSPMPAQGLDDARKAVEQAALASQGAPLDPIQSLNSQILSEDVHKDDPLHVLQGPPVNNDMNPVPPMPGQAPNPAATPLPSPNNMPSSDPFAQPNPSLPPNLVPPNAPLPPEQTGTSTPPTAPPPVPPPMMPPNFGQPPVQPPNQPNDKDFNVPL